MSIIIIIHWRCSWILCSIIQNVIQFQPNAFSINVINTITRIKFRFKIHLCFKIHRFEFKIQKSRGEETSSIGHCRKFAILQIIVALFHSLCPAHNLSVCTSHRRWHINFVEINSHHIVHFSFRSEKDHQSLTAAASYRHPSKRLGEVKPIELEWRSCHTSTLPHFHEDLVLLPLELPREGEKIDSWSVCQMMMSLSRPILIEMKCDAMYTFICIVL